MEVALIKIPEAPNAGPFQLLPPELRLKILVQLSSPSLTNMEQVSPFFLADIEEGGVWGKRASILGQRLITELRKEAGAMAATRRTMEPSRNVREIEFQISYLKYKVEDIKRILSQEIESRGKMKKLVLFLMNEVLFKTTFQGTLLGMAREEGIQDVLDCEPTDV